jgi:hypothetical protein
MTQSTSNNEAPRFCCIKLRTVDGHYILLRSSFHQRELYPLRYWVDVTMHTPCGPQTWPIDIREFLLNYDAGDCPVCVLGVWVNQHSRGDLIYIISQQPKIERV